jgi:hypothetical protein
VRIRRPSSVPVPTFASVANGVVGVVQAGIPLVNEIGASTVVAWYLSRRHATKLKV